jgi:hypothetical protein
MSKQHPNQDFYKTGGSEQTDGPDRGEPVREEKQQQKSTAWDRNAKHPAVLRSKRK